MQAKLQQIINQRLRERLDYINHDPNKLIMRDLTPPLTQQILQDLFDQSAPGTLILMTTFGPDTPMGESEYPDMHDIGDYLLQSRFEIPVVDREVLTIKRPNESIDYEIITITAWIPEQKQVFSADCDGTVSIPISALR